MVEWKSIVKFMPTFPVFMYPRISKQVKEIDGVFIKSRRFESSVRPFSPEHLHSIQRHYEFVCVYKIKKTNL